MKKQNAKAQGRKDRHRATGVGAALRAGASLGELREKARAAATQEDCAFSRGSPKDAAEGRPCPRTQRNLFASLRLRVLLFSIG